MNAISTFSTFIANEADVAKIAHTFVGCMARPFLKLITLRRAPTSNDPSLHYIPVTSSENPINPSFVLHRSLHLKKIMH
ncbi:unnamed protein product [Dovyalis caffra]|uniref:Uncharacterized protein n=1 Tax=Dovyalis caffra TaxID=77055 RepID=A0AAV1RAP3_9ROSI|nr:unnamed protein product [Dovyalis caffra]